jgi:hypothetical protein
MNIAGGLKMYRAKRETISYIAIQIITMRKEQRNPACKKAGRKQRENSGSEVNDL